MTFHLSPGCCLPQRTIKASPEQVCGWASCLPSENLESEQREPTAESFFCFLSLMEIHNPRREQYAHSGHTIQCLFLHPELCGCHHNRLKSISSPLKKPGTQKVPSHRTAQTWHDTSPGLVLGVAPPEPLRAVTANGPVLTSRKRHPRMNSENVNLTGQPWCTAVLRTGFWGIVLIFAL